MQSDRQDRVCGIEEDGWDAIDGAGIYTVERYVLDATRGMTMTIPRSFGFIPSLNTV